MGANAASDEAHPSASRRRKVWLGVGAGLTLLVGVVAWFLPAIARRVALDRIAEATGRAVRIDGVTLNPFTGRFAVTGFRLADRGEAAVFLAFERLEGRLAMLSLLRAEARLSQLTLTRPSVRVVRTADEFNFSDLLPRFSPAPGRTASGWTVSLERLAVVDGSVLFEDRAVSPVTTWRLEGVSVEGIGLTTRRAAPPGRLALRGRVGVGAPASSETRVTVDASSLSLAPLAMSARASAGPLALEALGPYLGEGLGALPTAGQMAVTLALELARDASALQVRASGQVDVDQLALAQRGRPAPLARVSRVAIAIKDVDLAARRATIASVGLEGVNLRAVRSPEGRIDLLDMVRGAAAASTGASPVTPPSPAPAPSGPPFRVLLERLTLRGAAAFVDEAVATTLDLPGISATVEGVTWPPAGARSSPATFAVDTGLPGGGRLSLRGQLTLGRSLEVEFTMSMRDAAVRPYQAYIPVPVRLSGRFNGDSRNTVRVEDGRVTTVSRGSSWAENVELRAPGATTSAVRVDRMELAGIDFAWPQRARVGRMVVRHPVVRVERAADGTINLRRLFTVSVRSRAPASAAPPGPSSPPASDTRPAPLGALALDIGELVVENGEVRFLDATTHPVFQEELSRLALSVRGLSSARGRRAAVGLQTIVGGDAALDLQGEIGPIRGDFFADLAGELRDFTLASVNPYADRALSWTIRRGKLGARVRYRFDAGQLTSENQLVVGDLQVAPSRQADEVKRRVGLPLGLIVALIKDERGDIRVSVPVSGTLTDPLFNWRDSIWTAVRNVLVNVITGPFKAIGRLFTRDGKIEDVGVEPVTFVAGSGVMEPAAQHHVAEVARFLRQTPAVTLVLRPVTTTGDVESLRGQELTARIQALQRARALPDVASAVGLAFAEELPDVQPPPSPEEQLARLRERQLVPEARLQELAARRLAATREALIGAGEVQPERLIAGDPAPGIETADEGRVEFTISE